MSKSSKGSSDPIRKDFRNFLFVVWRHLNLPTPTKRQYEMAEFLQHAPKRRMLRAWRASAETDALRGGGRLVALCGLPVLLRGFGGETHLEGLEPSTFGSVDRRSIQLS